MTALTGCSPMPELLDAPRPAGWENLRQAAERALEAQRFPTLKDEAWKYTDLKTLRETTFTPVPSASVDIREHILPEAKGTRLVFVNGRFDAHSSNVSALPAGVRLLNLASASEAAKELGALATPEASDVFANLNTARFLDGAYLFVPKGVRVESPVHVLFLGSAQQDKTTACALSRLLVVLEKGAEAHLVEEHAGHGAFLNNAVAEIHVHEGASLGHERIQRQPVESFHIGSLHARIERNARYASRTVTLGAGISRQSPSVVLADEGAELNLDGLALLNGSQIADTHSFIDHTKPNGVSRQLHKTIADDRSRAIFNGKIFVRPGAQATDAQQQSRNLLLSEQAQVDTKPELEIFADDVKCAHGATVGQLDPEELFYLQSRGLNLTDAQNLLTYGFAADLIDRIPVPSLKRQLQQAVLDRTHSAGAGAKA